MDMLDVLKGRLPEGLTIVSVKEMPSKFKIGFDYQGSTAIGELPKSCAPGYHEKVADHTVCTVMSTLLLGKGELDEAKKWLSRIVGN